MARLRRVGLVPIVLVLLLFAGCSSGGGQDAGGPATETTAIPSRIPLKPTIELGVTDWTGARLNAAIAEQLIERRLGYPVEQVMVSDTGRMLRELQSGELDAVLEIWPSALDPEEREIIESPRVDDLGELGVIGKIGWFVPRYVLDQYPEVATWEGLTDPEVAAAFAAAGTGGRGRFLGTDPGYEQHDEEIIESLGLPFEVIYSGSDQATAAEVERAVAAGEPILLYWWTPTAEIRRFDLVGIELPSRTAQCLADIESGSPQSCDYPADRLLKVGSPLLMTEAPDLRAFLDRFSLTTEDQLAMIGRVEVDGASIESVAADWISANQNRWEAWLG